MKKDKKIEMPKAPKQSKDLLAENNKIACGEKHCEAIGVGYEKITKLRENKND